MSSKEKKRKNDNNLKEQLKLSLKSYRNSFSAQTTPDLLVDLNDYNANLLPLLKNSLTNNNNQISIIYGFPGFGRKCSIDYCLNSLKETYLNFKKLYIDASVFGTEDSFINCLLEQLYNKKIKKKSEELSFSDLFKNFLKTNKKEKIVFVIDEAECLASPKKQTILYSLLEWIRNENNGILLFFLTNNIMFSDLLEKRVKSRLSQT